MILNAKKSRCHHLWLYLWKRYNLGHTSIFISWNKSKTCVNLCFAPFSRKSNIILLYVSACYFLVGYKIQESWWILGLFKNYNLICIDCGYVSLFDLLMLIPSGILRFEKSVNFSLIYIEYGYMFLFFFNVNFC